MNCYSDKYNFSFIVIGRNEGWKLSLCFQSILKCVETCSICNYEILYIDSYSLDDSIERAKRIPNIKIFSIIGKCNAAIARNIGGREAKGNILFFLDGDMELQTDFIPYLFNKKGELIHPFISGINYHWHYDEEWNLLSKEAIQAITKDQFQSTTGGFFIIEKELWIKQKGMDVRLTANQDIDLGLRLIKQGIPLLRIAKIGVIHHTLSMKNSNSKMRQQLSRHKYRGVLVRKHLFRNKYYRPIFFRMNYTAILLLISLIGTFLYPLVLIIYLLAIVLRSMKRMSMKNITIVLFYIIRDFVFIYSLLFFYPKKNNLNYLRII